MTVRSQMVANAAFFFVLTLGVSNSQPATAQIFDWINTSGTPIPFYDVADNWSSGGPPDDTQTARFNQAGAYEVWWDATTVANTPSVEQLHVLNGDVLFKYPSVSTQPKLSVLGAGTPGLRVDGIGTRLTIEGIELESSSGTEIFNGAELTIDGSHVVGSTLANGGQILLSGGSGGNSASLKAVNGGLVNGAAAPASLWVEGDSSVMVDGAGSQVLLDRLDLFSGNLDVANAGFLQTNLTDTARVDIGALDGAMGTVTVDGAGSRWKTFEMGVGLFGGTGLVTAQDGGRIESDFINIGGFDSTGTVRVTGTGSEVVSTGINVGVGAFNALLDVKDGGRVTSNQGLVNATAATGSGHVSIVGAGSRWDIADSLTLGGAGSIFVGSEGALTTNSASLLGGATLISGANSSWINDGRMDIENHIDVTSGGLLRSGSMFVGGAENGTLDVRGTGSTLDIATNLAVGGFSDFATLRVRDGASADVGGTAAFGLAAFGNLELTDGTFQAGKIDVGTSGNLVVDFGGHLITEDLNLNGALNLTMGTIDITGADSILVVNQSAFNFLDPTLELDDSTLNVAGQTVFGQGVEVSVKDASNFNAASVINDGTINVASSAIMGSNTRHDGFGGSGTLNVGSANVVLNDAGLADLGRVTNINGGTISATNGISIGTGDTIVGQGTIDGRISGNHGSAIYVSNDNMTVGDATHVAGFSTAGEIYTGNNALTILDANQVRLGSITQLGDSSGAGSLIVDNGAIINFGGNLVGHGTIDNQNNLASAIVNNGDMIGDSIVDRLVVEGYVKGVGTFDNVQFNGTFAPGLSPACVDGTNFFFGSGSNLEIEIGGSIRCAEHDAIRATGLLALDGTLDVLLINGFNPELGDSFDLFDWDTIDGEFASFDLPTLDSGLRWDLSDLYNTGSVSISAVPEPNSAIFLGLAAVAFFSRRQTRAV